MSIESKVYLDLARIWNLGPGEVEKIVRDYIGAVTCDFKPLQPYPKPHIKPVKVKTLKERLEEKEMNATSVQVINEVKDMSVTIERGPLEETRIIISVSTDDDTYEINCSGDGCEKFLRKKDFVPIKEYEYVQNQLMELEKGLGNWKKEAAECLKLRDEAQKEVYKLKQENEKLKELKTPTIENFEEPSDNVNHPSHYTGKYECIDVMQDVFGDDATNDFCLCNAFKYIWRARKKNGLEDVKKAIWYLNKYLELTEKEV